MPKVILELGPGRTLGTGIAALLSGAEKYYALDVVEDVDKERTLQVLDELVDLFAKREEIPGEGEFPRIQPYLSSYEFPGQVLTGHRLRETLRPTRLEYLRNEIGLLPNDVDGEAQVEYHVPWHDRKSLIGDESVDMVLSQAVLEFADDLADTYRTIHQWLRPGGLMSHRIDLTSHGTTKEWNGHWTYTEPIWRLMVGRRPYRLNREPHSSHINLIRRIGFEIVCDIKSTDVSRITRRQLAPRYSHISDHDLTTSGVFIQAAKRK